ncbi:SUKH-4 family immunity protein [Streptomyces sp. Pv4-95]|uniref:SUKH-4 family immunity protein n=1 Tax=Streptomyces sp. Pv4-95 TaxID=3049543 RepID=UPI003891F633
MTSHDQAEPGASGQEIISLLVRWWQNRRPGDRLAHLADPSGSDGAVALREVHRQVEGSVLLDAAGRTAEEVHAEALRSLGVDVSPGKRSDWRHALRGRHEKRLILIMNAHRAGRTRSSSEPDKVISWTAKDLSEGETGVILHHTPFRLSRLSDVSFTIQSRGVSETAWPTPVRALALAQPRVVPLRVWVELTLALGEEPVTENALHSLLENYSDHLVSGEHGVAFADEGLAEELRHSTGDEEVSRVNRHMAEWLTEISPEFLHPEGWAKSGPEGLYAAEGLAMHAAQADSAEAVSVGDGTHGSLFMGLLQDGGALANIPQTTLMDAAYCAFVVDLPGNSAAGDAIHLWSYGVIPPSQPEWAAWLHLMATARGDRPLAAAITDSGVHLPWKAKWTHWRPPGGYHWRFLEPGPVDGLVEVRWQGRPAVAALESWTSRADIWDAVSGEPLAGPWYEEIPEEYHCDLSWPPGEQEGGPGPQTVDDFEDAISDEEAVHDLFLGSPPLSLGNQVIVGGSGGLFAIESTEGKALSGINYSYTEPFSGRYAFTTAVTPVDAPPPGPSDLVELYGPRCIHAFPASMLPEGITDEPTRRTLIEFGLPALSNEDGLGIYPLGDSRMDIFEEVNWPANLDTVKETGPFFQIGFWMGGELVIDGPTGHVLRVPTEHGEEHLAGLPAAHSLESFLTMVALWVTGHLTRGLVEGDDEAYLLPDHVLAAHKRIDPVGAEAPAWAYAFHNS